MTNPPADAMRDQIAELIASGWSHNASSPEIADVVIAALSGARTDRDGVIKAATQITANDRECAQHLLDDLEEYQVNELPSKIETVARWFRKMRVAGVHTVLKSAPARPKGQGQ